MIPPIADNNSNAGMQYYNNVSVGVNNNQYAGNVYQHPYSNQQYQGQVI